MSDDLDFIVIDDIPEYVFCIPDDEELENVIPVKGEDGSFKYEKVAELPETGEDGVLYLVPKSHETQTASGNPISINVTEGAGKLSDLKLDSDTTQVTLTGKNKIDGANPTDANLATVSLSNDIVTVSSTSTATVPYARWVIDGISQNDVIRYSAVIQDNNGQIALQYDNNGSWATLTTSVKQYTDGTTPATYSWTNTVNTTKVRFLLYANKTIPTSAVSSRYKDAILTVNNLDLSYEQYCGNTPSPNPDYPQDINVVTGTQTIDINSTSYPINLGNIELAKIGTYQDRIYKNDGKWYIEKQVGHIQKDVEIIAITANGGQGAGNTISDYGAFAISKSYWANVGGDYDNDIALARLSTNCGQYVQQNIAGNSAANAMQDGTFCQRATNDRIYFRFSSLAGKTSAELKAILAAQGGADFWYILPTPTATAITDANLINQLEAARNAALANGTNVISNTATGNNLAGDLELSYYEYDPTNKYNKWLWLDDDAAYEQM